LKAGSLTLAMRSFMTFVVIVPGSTRSIKIQYHKLVCEEETRSPQGPQGASQADFHLLPNSLHKLDAIQGPRICPFQACHFSPAQYDSTVPLGTVI
jgi:hypothetical protein